MSSLSGRSMPMRGWASMSPVVAWGLAKSTSFDDQFIQKGRLGVASGQGFYSYPDPAFAQPGFHLNLVRAARHDDMAGHVAETSETSQGSVISAITASSAPL